MSQSGPCLLGGFTLQHRILVILHERSDQKLVCLIYTGYTLSLHQIRDTTIPISFFLVQKSFRHAMPCGTFRKLVIPNRPEGFAVARPIFPPQILHDLGSQPGTRHRDMVEALLGGVYAPCSLRHFTPFSLLPSIFRRPLLFRVYRDRDSSNYENIEGSREHGPHLTEPQFIATVEP